MDATVLRIDQLEAKVDAAYKLLDQVTEALVLQREKIDEERARLSAHVVLTSAILSALQRVAPEAAAEIVTLLERSEREFARSGVHEATVQELREVLGALRAQTTQRAQP